MLTAKGNNCVEITCIDVAHEIKYFASLYFSNKIIWNSISYEF